MFFVYYRRQGFFPSTINGVDCCYNESKKLGYREFGTHERYFNINGYECGKNCDFDGKNCQNDINTKGVCNLLECQIDKGYSEIKKGSCYNPQTKLVYDRNNNFYIDGKLCGGNCDLDGKNCSEGICNISTCAVDFVSPVRSNS